MYILKVKLMRKLLGMLIILLASLSMMQVASAAAPNIEIEKLYTEYDDGTVFVDFLGEDTVTFSPDGSKIADVLYINFNAVDANGDPYDCDWEAKVYESDKITLVQDIYLNPTTTDNPKLKEWNGEDNTSVVVDGTYYLIITAINPADTTENDTKEITIIVDTVKPILTQEVFTADKPSFDIVINSDEEAFWNNDFDNKYVKEDKASTDNKKYTMTVEDLEDDTYYLFNVYTIDIAGNQAEDLEVKFTTDFVKTISLSPETKSVIIGRDDGYAENSDDTTTAQISVEIENKGNILLNLNADDFSIENLIYQHLDDSNDYIIGDTYKDDFYIDAYYFSNFALEDSSIGVGAKTTLTFDLEIPADVDFDMYGHYKGDLTFDDSNDVLADLIAVVDVIVNPEHYLKRNNIEILDITYEDDEDYYRTDEVEIKITIENTNNDDEKVSSIDVTLMIPELKIDESASKFSLSEEGDEKELTFTFEIDEKAESGDYPIYIFVSADSEDDNGNDFDIDMYDYGEILSVNVEDDDLIVESITFDENDYEVGDTVTAKVNVRNIGTDEQEDVRVRFKCTDVGYSELSEIYDKDLKSNKEKLFTFIFDIPSTAKAGSYLCNAEIMYDGSNGQADDDDVSEHMIDNVALEIVGEDGIDTTDAQALITGTTTATVSANDAVKFTLNLENKGTGLITYTIKAEGYSDWADARIEPAELTIPAGSSVPFYTYITPKDGATGLNSATVSAYVDGVNVASKAITVTVNSVTDSGDSGITVSDLGNAITGAASLNVNTSTAIIISSIIGGIVLLGAIYMFTLGKNPL
jgi:hypothetical protein